jgi:hypothetical protein
MANRDQYVMRRQRRTVCQSPQGTGLTYNVTLTDDGKWLNAPGSDFVFAYLKSDWPPAVITAMTTAFETALKMPTAIKASVKATSGQDVVNGLYLLNQPAMTTAMNAIDGMGLTGVTHNAEEGSGTAASINGEFFGAVLGGLGGDVAPMMDYLTTQMGDLQAQTKQSTVTDTFGTIIGMISVMPVLNVPVTTFRYVFSSKTTSTWFVSIPCGSVENQSYDYSYTAADYGYNPSSK